MGPARLAVLVVAVAMLGACATPSPIDDSFEPSGLMASPTETLARSASDLLDCDGPVSTMGGFADDFGPDGIGSTPDEAFEAWLEIGTFGGLPRGGYERQGSIGGRFVYTYSVDERIKVVAVISGRFSELVGGAPFTIEELRTCDPSEYGAAVDLGPGRRVWANETTGRILDDIAGPAHCGWESARMLHITGDDGTLTKQYLRDPDGVFSDVPGLLAEYDEGVELPADATFSGYRTDDGLELWSTSDDRAAYVVTPDGVERWPRADPPIACA